MNKENAHQYLPLIRALADGKKLQIAYTSDPNAWYDAEEINFIWDLSLYRIKPEPRKFKAYIIDTRDGETVLTTHPTFDSRWEQITVQEVVE